MAGIFRMNRDLKEFQRLERICVGQAELATMEPEKAGLLKVAEDCRRAAAELERAASEVQNLFDSPATWALLGIGLFLFVALYLPW